MIVVVVAAGVHQPALSRNQLLMESWKEVPIVTVSVLKALQSMMKADQLKFIYDER